MTTLFLIDELSNAALDRAIRDAWVDEEAEGDDDGNPYPPDFEWRSMAHRICYESGRVFTAAGKNRGWPA